MDGDREYACDLHDVELARADLCSGLRASRGSIVIRDILRMGDPRLLEVARPVTDPRAADIRALVADMFDTMHAADGAGLAAPQIGVGLRVVIFGYRDAAARNPRYPDADPVPETILINPELTPLGDELEEGWEGCLSVPGLRGVVPRHARLRYRGLQLDGTLIEREVGGFHARVVQHECDHLDGILYPMRVTDFTRFGYTDVLFPGMVDTDD
jgi:peptide deformylase